MKCAEVWQSRISDNWRYPEKPMPTFGPRSGKRQVLTWLDKSGNMALISFTFDDLLDQNKAETLLRKMENKGANLPVDDLGKRFLRAYWFALAAVAQVTKENARFGSSNEENIFDALMRQCLWLVTMASLPPEKRKRKRSSKKLSVRKKG